MKITDVLNLIAMLKVAYQETDSLSSEKAYLKGIKILRKEENRIYDKMGL